uniref:SUI1 domain-containing protein n=1 Tax=Magnetococcus massalia (strain MO-1) TaxID=451514 RepID=A0A1S7LJ54_MAGMO|nr:conserved protein of unknown function [Candidatus Magnetococcus massalia]
MSRIVYSTDQGRICPNCSNPVDACSCRQAKAGAPNDGIVRVSRETKGRKGKGVTVIKGVALDSAGLTQLAKKLKATCGSGGTVKEGSIEIQGDHRERVMAYLTQQGMKVKRAGG